MAKKKGGIIKVAMQCPECKKVNGFTSINKAKIQKLTLKKYCNQCKKHLVHTSREKLK